ncbi:hypothetical protein HOC37_04165 [bacterium]|jgi:dihydrofolate synthase / folylpolyglutamate synthase|nr:hypothetical protein [bacterium]MBT3582105.1 hypothetical protein [bacterium]MBT4552161.1 hypothetical protein [bacterium]MBT5988387.1 hypothetical protein [bacterium]MBT7087826.1 hypothetical protein [bacterium]
MSYNYQQTIKCLQNRVYRKGINYNLDNLLNFLKTLGSPQKKLKNIIHIAGTNGKGSTLTFIASALKEAGFRVGTFTSPHILDYTERIALNFKPISKNDFSKFFNQIKNIPSFTVLSEFEILTIISILYFIEQKPDFIIYEVGLGGRLDATNIFSPILTIITKIGLDHQEILGKTLLEITKDKAGIIKSAIPLITIKQAPKVLSCLKKIAQQNNVPMTVVKNPGTIPKGYLLTGLFQKENLALAKQAIQTIKGIKGSHMQCVKPEVWENGFKKAFIWGRYLMLEKNKQTMIIDSAHNALGIKKLVASLKKDYPAQKLTFLIGIKSDKDISYMLNKIRLVATKIYYCDWQPGFSYPFTKAKKATKQVELEEIRLDHISKLPKDTPLVITGSIYFISHIKPYLD